MGLVNVKCKCGCGKSVQRGSRYFLEQSLGLKFGVEAIDVYHQNYLTRIDGLDKRIDPETDLRYLDDIRSKCNQMSNLMLKVAHDGPSGLLLSRRDVEKLNIDIIQIIWRMEDLNLPELVSLRAHERMSKPQRMLYRAFTKSMNP